MENSGLIPFIRAIENEQTLSTNKKDVLCLLLASLTTQSEGLLTKEIKEATGISTGWLYKIIISLERDGLVTRHESKQVTANLEGVEGLIKKQEAKKDLISKTLKLRIASKKSDKIITR